MRECWRSAFAAGLLASLVVIPPGCSQGSGGSGPQGDAKATISYWEAIQKPLPESNNRQILSLVEPVNPDRPSQLYIVSVLRAMATAQKERCDRLAMLPVRGVDPEAAAYSVDLMQTRQETAAILEATAAALERGSGLPGGDEMAFDFLVSLFRHANDGDEAFWNVVKEQAADKATGVAHAKSRALALQDRFEALQARSSAVRTSELAVRIKLAQRYNREFPAQITPPSQPMQVPTGSAASPRTKEQISQDLLGHKVPDRGSSWTFDSPNEYRSLAITGSLSLGDIAVVEISTRVVGQVTGAEKNFKIRLLYQKDPDGWKLAVVQQQ